MVFWAFFSTHMKYTQLKTNAVHCLTHFFPLTETCFHNLLNQPSIDDADIWNYCQLFTTTNNAALSTIIGSKSRNISNLEILPNCLTKKKKKSLSMLPPSTWECPFSYHPIKTSLLSASTKCCSLVRLSFSDQSSVFLFSYLHWILSPLLFSLNTCSFRMQISQYNLRPKSQPNTIDHSWVISLEEGDWN